MDDWAIWLVRIMFVGIFPLGVGMLYRAWKIGVRRDFRFVADWRGHTIRRGRPWTKWVLAINLAGGISLLTVGTLVLLVGLPFSTWTGLTALILWSYFFLLQLIVGRARRQPVNSRLGPDTAQPQQTMATRHKIGIDRAG